MGNYYKEIEYPEIFLGIVSPIGVDTQSTIGLFSEFFKQNGYDVVHIKITDFFKYAKSHLDIDLPLSEMPSDERIKSYIAFGNEIRKIFSDNSILAMSAIYRIMKNREKKIQKNDNISFERRVYIINQLKRKEEIDLLRAVYGRSFFQVSVYSKRESRVHYMASKIAHDKNRADLISELPMAHSLVSLDENEKNHPNGQRVGKIFHDADVIITTDVSGYEKIKDQVFRFCELLFSSNQISPTKQEYGMFAAKAAALRTLDLSRQVGAAIFRSTGEIISMGSNEVPKAGGGTYWCDDPFDAREYISQEDSNEKRKRELLLELLKSIFETDNTHELLQKEEIIESQFMDALEYGRIVHAEMSAISDAARMGLSIKNSTLYCTTFPCHMCAKHIVASGVKNVVFLEPYPKSLAVDLHSDSIVTDGLYSGHHGSHEKVVFEHFYGITPRRYRELFERGSRKSNGKYQPYIKGIKRPNIALVYPFYVALEVNVTEVAIEQLKEVLSRSRSTLAPEAD